MESQIEVVAQVGRLAFFGGTPKKGVAVFVGNPGPRKRPRKPSATPFGTGLVKDPHHLHAAGEDLVFLEPRTQLLRKKHLRHPRLVDA